MDELKTVLNSSFVTHHSSFRMNTERTLIVVPTYNERENVARLVS